MQFDYQLPSSFVQVRVDVQFARGDFQQQVLDRRKQVQVPDSDVEVDIVACDDLTLLTLIAGRMLDLADAAGVLRHNARTMDLRYLMDWARRLKVSRELRQIWDEAFPGYAPPDLPPREEASADSSPR